MKTVGACEAKTDLPKLLERVARGERIVITRHGVPVAMILPAESIVKSPMNEAIEQLKRFRKNHRLGSLSIRAMLDDGRP